MFENFRLKTPEELENQAREASNVLGEEAIQPSKKDEIFNMSIEEIKQKFPVRYEAYLKILRMNKQKDGDLSEEDKEEMTSRLKVLNNLDKYIEDHWVNGEKTLRGRQITVFEDIRDFLEKGGRDGYVKLPTGAGKTVIFSEFIEATGLRALIVVPTKILVGQTEERINEFAEDLDVGKIYSEAKKQGTDVTIVTYQSLVRKINEGTINPNDYECLVLDEAHVSLSKDRVRAVNKFNHAIRLGFTATPQYSGRKKVQNILSTEIHNLGVKEAAEEGIVSPFSVILAETNIDISDVKISASGEYSQEDLNRAINIEGRNNSAVDLYKQLFAGQLGIVYCSGIEHAEDIKKIFTKNGVNAEVISGKNTTKEQQEILRRFKNGEIMILCNADILTAGFDEQKASVCLNLRPTLSSVMAEQRGGRVLRLDNSNPSKHATIVDFIDKNTDSRNHQITFAEIANASIVYSVPAFKEPQFDFREPPEIVRTIRSDIKIEGLNIITDPKEVMRVVNKMKEEGGKEKLTYESLKKDVLEKGIKSSDDYAKSSSKHNWPAPKTLISMPDFPKKPDGSNDWDTFLGKEKKKEWTYETLRKDILEKGIKSSDDYGKSAPKNNWPVIRTLTSMPDFPKNADGSNDWDTFFQKEKWTYESLRKEVLKNGIKSSTDYVKSSPKNNWPSPITLVSMPDFPKKPDGSNDWDSFFGKEKKKEWTYETLRKDILEKGIKSSKDYSQNAQKYSWPIRKLGSMPDFPKKPDGSNDWGAFFGRERWTYENLRRDVLEKGIKSSKKYSQNTSKNNWPVVETLISMPDFPKKPDGSNDWDTFLGKEKKKEWTYETLRKDILEKGIKSSKDYGKSAPKNNWPAPITLVSMPDFPKKPDGSNDWNTFLGRSN